MGIDALIDELIDREGGLVARAADRGGPTRFEITDKVARSYCFEGEVRQLPREQAVDIYRRLYWLEPHLDAVAQRAPRIAAELFDTGANRGPRTAACFLQRALNALNRGATDYADIILDGAIGPGTLASLDGFLARRGAAGETVLLKAIEALQRERYVRLAESRPANEAFLYGWLANRIGLILPTQLSSTSGDSQCFSTASSARSRGNIDKIVPDPKARDQAKLELLKLQGSQDLDTIKTQFSAILAEAQSIDPWTSRARPSFF